MSPPPVTWPSTCGKRLRKVHRGDDHRGAGDLLRTAVPDGKKLATKLGRLLDLKDEAHYGIFFVSARKASDAVRAARTLVGRGQPGHWSGGPRSKWNADGRDRQCRTPIRRTHRRR